MPNRIERRTTSPMVYNSFQTLLFSTSIVTLVSELVFGEMDERLINYIIEKSENGELRSTHQKIAHDLGMSIEVVRRLIKDFERQGLSLLTRNLIQCKGL